MGNKRVFKTKSFDRWAKKVIRDDLLYAAAREVERGRYEANLGGGVCKKRIALPGRGKSGSMRTLVAKGHGSAIFFLAGRQKDDPGRDFSEAEEEAAKIVAKGLHAADPTTLERMCADGILREIGNDEQGS
jgi:hypothetical protein